MEIFRAKLSVLIDGRVRSSAFLPLRIGILFSSHRSENAGESNCTHDSSSIRIDANEQAIDRDIGSAEFEQHSEKHAV